MKIVMVLGQVDSIDRIDLENIEDVLFYDKNNFIETTKLKDVRFLSLSYFMDEMNNEEIRSSEHWFGYIRLESMEGVL
jgi:hypothetical protein